MGILFVSMYSLSLCLMAITYMSEDLFFCQNFSNSQTNTCIINMVIFRNGIENHVVNVTFISNVIFGPVPASLVCVGCLCLAGKIIRRNIQRSSLTNTTQEESCTEQSCSSLRPTLTVLAVCLLYGVCSVGVFLIQSWVAPGEQCELRTVTLAEFANGFAILNSSANFVIYVVIDRRYRSTYVELYVPKWCVACFNQRQNT